MPQIQEYLPEVGAQGPVGGVSPNVELAGAAGRGLERIGEQLEVSADLIHRKKAQEETADIFSSFADKRAEYTEQIQKGIQDGSLDVDKFKDQYDEDTYKISDRIETGEGRNFFERQQARLKGHLLQMATSGQALVAANMARGKWKDGVTQTSSSLMATPWAFHDSYEAGLESIDELVKNGGLPEKFKDKAAQEMGTEYSKGAIRGWAELNPDKAKQLIDAGAFDQFLNTDQKHQMQMEVSRYAHAQTVESSRTQKAVDDAQKAASEKWGQEALPKLTNNALSTKDVLGAVRDGTLKWEQGDRWLKMIDEGTKKEVKTDPRKKNQLIDRIVNPDSKDPITTTEDLMPYVGHGLSIQDFNQMNSLFNKTPEQQAVKQGEKALFDSAKKSIRFKNMLTGQWDSLGEQKLGQFMSDYTTAKKKIQESGGSVSDLLDARNAMYFGGKLDDYQTSLQDQTAHVARDRTDKALGLRPSAQNPDAKPTDKDVRRSGETPEQYLKRRGLGGG